MAKYLKFIALVLCMQSCQKEILIFDAEANSDYELPLLLRIDGNDCFFDEKRGTLKYSINEEALANFSPFIEFQKWSEVTFENIVLFNEEVNEIGALELNRPYRITVRSGEMLSVFKLIFTNIPTLRIVSLDQIVNEPKILSKITVNYPEYKRKSQVNWVGVEQRGASSLKRDKKSLSLEILGKKSIQNPKIETFFDLTPNSRYTLNAMYSDRSRLRNKLSFDLWKSLRGRSEHIGIESRFVEVYINYESLGVFTFTDDYTKEFLSIGDNAVFYEGIDNTKNTKFNTLGDDRPNSAIWEEWEQLFPDPSERIVWSEFVYLNSLVITENDEVFKDKISDLLDFEIAIDYYLFINLIMATDNVGKNWHFLKRDIQEKFIIVPWDLDGTWGRRSDGLELFTSAIVTNGLFQRLEEVNPNDYNERTKVRWRELRSSEFAEANLGSLIDDLFSELNSYNIIGLEIELWDVELDLVDEQAYIENWLRNRLILLDKHFDL